MAKIKDVTGIRYGMLTVKSWHSMKNGAARWLCLCDCGEYTIVYGGSLRSGTTKSCGCLRKHPQRGWISGNKHPRFKDRTGERHGKLTVIRQVEANTKGISWLCKCDCGRERIVSSVYLAGNAKSCGYSSCKRKVGRKQKKHTPQKERIPQKRVSEFSDMQILQMRYEYESELLTYKQLGERYGTTANKAYYILNKLYPKIRRGEK